MLPAPESLTMKNMKVLKGESSQSTATLDHSHLHAPSWPSWLPLSHANGLRKGRTRFVPAPSFTVVVAAIVNPSFPLSVDDYGDDYGSRLPLVVPVSGQSMAAPET